MTVAVVIPSWNGAGLLPRCLSALRRQSPLLPDEVVVVDNGSTDGSAAMLARDFPEVRVVRHERNLGFAAAVNAGIRATAAPLVALLNNDAEPEPGWLTAMVVAMGGRRVGMVASRIVDAANPERIQGIGLEVDRDGNPAEIGQGQPDGPGFDRSREVFGPIAAAALYRREVFDDVGPFDERFFAYLEDVDLAWRAGRAGWRCMYAPDAVVRHARGSTARRVPRRIRYLLWRNHLWLLAKNADRSTLLRYAVRQPLRDARDLLRLLARGRPLDALVLVSARVAALVRLPAMLRPRMFAAPPHPGHGRTSARDGRVTPEVSVVIVSYNTEALLARCLRSVMADAVGAAAEVLVVDNASVDGSPDMVRARFPRVRLLVNDTNRGFAAACNQALARTSAGIVVLLNSDATLEPGALDRLLDVLDRRPDVGIVGARLVGADGGPQRSYGRIPGVSAFVAEMLALDRVPVLRRVFPTVASVPRRRERTRAVGHVSGACLAVRREVLGEVGLLDERFFLYFEETDLCLRAARAGWRVWLEPSAVVRHVGQASARRLGPDAEIHYARSAYAFIRKHRGERAGHRLGTAFRLWLGAQAFLRRVQAAAGRPGARDAVARKRRLMRLHRSLGQGAPARSCPCGQGSVRMVRIGRVDGIRCRRCALLARAEMPTAGSLSRWYRDRYWNQYGREESAGRDGVYRHALRCLEPVLAGGGTLVDVGCGSGELLALCRDRGWAATGFDPSMEAVALARARGLDARLRPWPGSGLPDGTAGAVIFINTLDHLPDPFAALREARRVLRPGGALYVRVPNGPAHAKLMNVLTPLRLGDLPVFHLYGFGRRTLRHHLERLGFRVVAVRGAPPAGGAQPSPGTGTALITSGIGALHRTAPARLLARWMPASSIEAIAVKVPAAAGLSSTDPAPEEGAGASEGPAAPAMDADGVLERQRPGARETA